LAVIFRCNTNTKWTWRVPLTKDTHFSDVCLKLCVRTGNRTEKSLLVAASRAAKQLVGYFCGYTTKRQVVGKYELDQAAASMSVLEDTLKKDSVARQLSRVTNRMLSDLQCRGMLRPATDETNLAANSVAHDNMHAEFIRTFRTQTFQGRRYLERLEWELKKDADQITLLHLPACRKLSVNSNFALTPHAAAYGFRGRHPSVYYLSPWEFCMFVQVVKLWPPAHPANTEAALTQWTDEGFAFYEAHKADDPPAELTPGLHWTVIEPENNLRRKDYVTYPSEGTLLQFFRHEWVMVLQERPHVPEPAGTPMPEKRHTVEERARLLSVYLRPWVLLRCHVTTHVPYLTDLNTVREWGTTMRDSVRKRAKTTPTLPPRCSWRHSWKEYARGHIVSWHSAKIISNFLAGTCCYSSHRHDLEEPEVDTKTLEKMPALSMSLNVLHASLQQMTDLSSSGGLTQIRKDVLGGCILADRLWNLKDLQQRRFGKHFTLRGHVDVTSDDEDMQEDSDTQANGTHGKKQRPVVTVGVANRIEIENWLAALQREAKPPGPQQLQILRMILERCLVEAREIRRSTINSTKEEPLRHMIQGLPGAGKSELIKWIRRAFEEVFGFQHGVHYVCLASQNTMASLIDGFTNHSWGGVPVTKGQLEQWQNTNWNTPQVSPLFEKNQHMRWILMDEGSTTSAEVFGIIESNVTRSTRATGTWKIRKGTNEERPFGGFNLLFFVDWWQLPPVKSTDLKSTPYPEKAASPMVQKSMTFFWNRSIHSFTGMTEMTHSYRQAMDPWFSEFLRQCRHGQLSWTRLSLKPG